MRNCKKFNFEIDIKSKKENVTIKQLKTSVYFSNMYSSLVPNRCNSIVSFLLREYFKTNFFGVYFKSSLVVVL